MRKKIFTFLLALVTSVGLSWATEGALSGAFAINSNGDQIVFSKGNLQYHCTNHVWQFATNQYDMIGGDNANISDSYDGWIDLFGYGTGNNPTLVSTSYGDYSTFTDWGVNAISNGGNEANLWRTLTSTEWLYMFRLRPEAHNKYGAATVANVPGIIVLPDVYVGPAINTVRDAWDNNVISSSEWAAYEAAGAVFLPAAGYRSGTTMYNVGSEGFCWSSTPDPGDAEYSYKLCLSPISVIEPQGFGRRNEGISVRLVKAASAQDIADVVIALINDIPNTVVKTPLSVGVGNLCMPGHKINDPDTTEKLCPALGSLDGFFISVIQVKLEDPVADSCGRLHIDPQHLCGHRLDGRELAVGYKNGGELKYGISRAEGIHIDQHEFIAADQDIVHMIISVQDPMAFRYCIDDAAEL